VSDARILLVTGSRALEDSAQEADARGLLRAFAEIAAPSVVVAGDARGPDEWAIEWAAMCGIPTRMWSLDGWIYDEHKARNVDWWKADKKRRGTESALPKPLQRNLAMVRSAAAKARWGAHVQVLALEASWSATKGTAHTAGLALRAGLAVVHTVITGTRIQEGSDEG